MNRKTEIPEAFVKLCGTKKIKSARTITSDDDIASIVRSRAAEREKAVGRSAGLALQVRDVGGRPMLCRRFGGALTIPDPSIEEAKNMVASAAMPWNDQYTGRIHRVWSSDERVNRYGDIDLQVWDFNNYDRNPLLLWSHDWDGMPIGCSVEHKVKTRLDDGYNGPALQQAMLFATKDQSELADSVHRLWVARFLRTVSVGFFAGMVIDVEDPEERASMGLGKWGLVFTDLELIELSPCSVPALPSAHASLVKDGIEKKLLQASDCDVIREAARKEVSRFMTSSEWKSMDLAMRNMLANAFPGTKMREHSKVDEPINFEASFRESEQTERFEKLLGEMSSRIQTLENTVTELSQAKKSDGKQRASIQLDPVGLAQLDALIAAGKVGVKA